MSVKIEDRPIEQVREQVIDQLIYNYSHGVISVEAFERRLDDAMAASDNSALMALVEDLTLNTDQQYKAQKHSQFAPNYGAQHEGSEEPLTLRSILGSSERSGQCGIAPAIPAITIFCGVARLRYMVYTIA